MFDSAGSSSPIPSDGAWDATLALLREGYHFIPNRCRRLGTNIFRTRLTLTDVICMQGPQAAELFYGSSPLTRQQAMPQTVLRLLQDKGSVQQLNGDEHRHRKSLFISLLMAPGQVERLVNIFREEWLTSLATWEAQERIVLIDEVNLILTRAVCRWAGVPVRDDAEMTTELAGMVEHAGHFRAQTLAALWRRRRTEKLARQLVQDFRSGSLASSSEVPLHRIATFVDMRGKPLTVEEAAVELINILRPVVAVGRFIVFAALQMHEQPAQTTQLEDEERLEGFAEEVRRKSPFFPFVGARVREEMMWQGHLLPKGQWVLLDLYGTTHDPKLFPEPNRFRIDRAISWRDHGYDFIPQGAGQAAVTHRCPGETITVELLKQSIRLLMDMDYTVPPQDLSVKMNRIPALPQSGFVIERVKARPER